MPSKKRKYNARFPAGRIKKIMQTDEEVGKVAQAVPVIISRTLELFVESLLTKAMEVTNAKNAKTLSPSHMKQCILSESRFDFLKDLVKNIPDINSEDNSETSNTVPTGSSTVIASTSTTPAESQQKVESPSKSVISTNVQIQTTANYSANIYTEQSHPPTAATASVIQYSGSVNNRHSDNSSSEATSLIFKINPQVTDTSKMNDVPPLIPIIRQPKETAIYNYCQSSDNLCIDEDYDN